MTRNHPVLRTAIACGVALCLSTTMAAAQEQTDDSAGAKDKAASSKKSSKQAVKIPEALRQLDLKQQQKKSIKQAIRKHDRKLHQTWLQFHEQHARAIELEAAWLAAVRDTLSKDDQRTFDEKRMQHQKQSQDADENTADSQSTARNESDAKSADAEQSKEKQQATADSEGRQRAVGIVLIRMTSPEQFTQGLRQDTSQKQQCSEVCREYQQALKTAWRDLHQLHLQMVEIEAAKMQAIENELTDEQLAELKDQQSRQQGSRTETSTAKDKDRATSQN